MSDFARPIFPTLIKPGSWSGPQWVVDADGLGMPAIMANSTTNHGFMMLPFNSGETVIGVTLTVCGDATTDVIINTSATQFSSAQRDNLTDGLVGIGSTISGGTSGVWHDVDVDTASIFLSDQSQLWLEIGAVQESTVSPPPPPSIAVGRVLIHMNH